MHPLIVSYFTPGTAYEEHAAALRKSADRRRLESRIESRPSKGSWVENCAQKAEFVREIRLAEKRPVLWVDADATILRPFHELDGCTADFAVVKKKGWWFQGGQIYFGAGLGADLIVETWERYCRDYPHIWDQVSLGYAWWDVVLRSDLQVFWLDEAIFEKAKRNFAGPLIQRLKSKAAVVQKQESRRSRAERQNEFGSDQIPGWWKDAAVKNKPFQIGALQRTELGMI